MCGFRLPLTAVPDSQSPLLGTREPGGAVPAVPGNGNRCGTGTGTGSHPIAEPPTGTGSGNRPREPVREHPIGDDLPFADSENSPHHLHTGGSGEPAKHEKSCPKCFGTGLDAVGKPCDYVEPVVHTEGIKKWDDESKTWVDAMMSDLGKYLENGMDRSRLDSPEPVKLAAKGGLPFLYFDEGFLSLGHTTDSVTK